MRQSTSRCILATALLLCTSICHAQYPTALSIEKEEHRYRLNKHRSLLQVPSSEAEYVNERELKRTDEAWAELSKQEKKAVKKRQQSDDADDTTEAGKDRGKVLDNGESRKRKDKSRRDNDRKKDKDKKRGKDKKKDKDKRDKDDKDKPSNWADLSKDEKKEYIEKEKHKDKDKGKDSAKVEKDDEVCICEDDDDDDDNGDDSDDDEWGGDHDRWLEEQEEWSGKEEDESVEPNLVYNAALGSVEQYHFAGRGLFNVFDLVFGKKDSKQQEQIGNTTMVAAKRKGENKRDKWSDDGHNTEDNRGSKSFKKSKKKGGKGMKSSSKSGKSSSKSSRNASSSKSGKSSASGSSKSDKSSFSKSRKSTKKNLGSKSSKPCKCRPLTRRPTQKPNKTRRPSQRPTRKNDNIAPLPTTQKPVRTARPSNKPVRPTRRPFKSLKPVRTSRPTKKPVRTSRPSNKPSFGKPTRRPSIITQKPVRTPRPSNRPTRRPTERPAFFTQKPVRTPRPSNRPTRRPTFITERPVITSRPSNRPTTRPNIITEKPVRTPRPSNRPISNPTGKPTRQPMTPAPTNPSINTWYYWGADEGIGGPPGDATSMPEPGFGDDVFCPAAGPRYTLLIEANGDAYAAGFIESKFEYLGHFGVNPDNLSEGSNDFERIDVVVDDGRERDPPPFAQVFTGATGSANSGETHSLLIDQNGDVYTTGNNNKGQLCLGDTEARFIPHKVFFDDDNSPAVAAALGEDFTLILLENGRVYGCGSNAKGELGLGSEIKSVQIPISDNGLSDVIALSSGLNFALFLTRNRKAYATGSNIYMQQCNDSSGEPTTEPKEIKVFSKRITALEAGSESSYFLFFDGTVSSCGRNDEGQLGDGTFIDSDKTSVIIPDDDIIVALGSGSSSKSAFFIGKNAVYGTGANDIDQLGIGEPGKVAVPTEVKFDDSVNIVEISSAGTHTVGCNLSILTDAPTFSPTAEPTITPPIACDWLYWGANEGRGGEVGSNQETPLLIEENTIDISAGPRYTLLIEANGDAYAAGFIESKFEYLGHFGVNPDNLSEGSNDFERIDVVVDGRERDPPPFAHVLTGATGSANSGETHSLLIDQNGDVYTAGNNNKGQLCLGDSEARFIPHKVFFDGDISPAVAAALGEDFTLILLENGRVYGCGSNAKGELGLGSNVKEVNSPNRINGLSDVIALSSGLNFALFLTRNRKAYSTGSNIYMQQCEDSDGEPNTTPKAIRILRNYNIQLIAAGRESSYFLLDDGEIKACGRNNQGQLGDGTYVNRELVTVDIPEDISISSIGSGASSQSAFFFGESSIYGAGDNDRYQLGIGEVGSRKFPVEIEFEELSSIAGIKKISASGTQSVALDCPDFTSSPSRRPTQRPSNKPTAFILPTKSPSNKPTALTSKPTPSPTKAPITPGKPTPRPSNKPTNPPSKSPSTSPTAAPTNQPTNAPIIQGKPTPSPSRNPSRSPTAAPTNQPTNAPIIQGKPTPSPSRNPSRSPTTAPTNQPTNAPIAQGKPTPNPTKSPSSSPSKAPSQAPTGKPTRSPLATSGEPTQSPTPSPTNSPSRSPSASTGKPTTSPTPAPSNAPSIAPTVCIEVPETNNTFRFEATDPLENAQLGYSVSVYNKTVVAGSPGTKSSAAIFAGGAYIFNFNYQTGLWEFVQKITTPASVTGDEVGFSTSIRGEWVVLGSPFNNQFGNSTGYAYFYKRGDGEDGDTFTQLASIFNPTFTINSNFGWSVSVNRNGTVAVGAPGNGGTGVGAVYIYKTATFAQWNLVGTIEPTDVTASFGWDVAINDDNTLYVSAPFDASGGSQTGSVSIYTEVSVDNWELLDKFTPSDSQNGDRFGISLDVDDTATFAVGSNGASGGAGAVYLYELSGGNVEFIQKLTSASPSASENFGKDVAIESGKLAVGAPNPGGIGTVYLYYNRTATNWALSETVGPVDEEAGITGEGILYGGSVGISFDALAVGAPGNDLAAIDSGSVYLYDVIVDNCVPETSSPTSQPTSQPVAAP